jgi:hypothetical protein
MARGRRGDHPRVAEPHAGRNVDVRMVGVDSMGSMSSTCSSSRESGRRSPTWFPSSVSAWGTSKTPRSTRPVRTPRPSGTHVCSAPPCRVKRSSRSRVRCTNAKRCGSKGSCPRGHPSCCALRTTRLARAATDGWGNQFAANPQWAMHFPTTDTFIAAVRAAAERRQNNDTVEGMAAFPPPASPSASHVAVDLEMVSHGGRRTEVLNRLVVLTGVSAVAAAVIVDTPGSLVASAIDRMRAETWADALRKEGALLRITTAT